MNFDKPGGFRWLDAWVMGSIVQLATFRFGDRFLTRQRGERKLAQGKNKP